jgi:hypothetical protein
MAILTGASGLPTANLPSGDHTFSKKTNDNLFTTPTSPAKTQNIELVVAIAGTVVDPC